jgi:hypothetical protein
MGVEIIKSMGLQALNELKVQPKVPPDNNGARTKKDNNYYNKSMVTVTLG